MFLFPEEGGGTTLLHLMPGRPHEYLLVNRAGMTFFSAKVPGGCAEILMDDGVLDRAIPALLAAGERAARDGRVPVNEALIG